MFIVFTNPERQSTGIVETKLNAWLLPLRLQKVTVVYLPSVNDIKSNATAYNINPAVANMLFVYKKRKVIENILTPN